MNEVFNVEVGEGFLGEGIALGKIRFREDCLDALHRERFVTVDSLDACMRHRAQAVASCRREQKVISRKANAG